MGVSSPQLNRCWVITVPAVTFLARRMSVKRLVCLALGLFLAGSAVDLIART